MVTKTSLSTRRTHYHGGVTNASANETDMSRLVPATVRGVWKDLGNGARFRLPTAYKRAELVLERGRPMVSNGYRKIGSEKWDYGRETGNGGYGIQNFFSGNFVYRYSKDIGIGNLLDAPSFVKEEENESVTKSLNKIADQKVNLGENLATLGQTARLFINPLQSAVKLSQRYREFRNLRPKDYSSVLPWGKIANMTYRDFVRGGFGTAIASKYLEFVYGFAPLMQDIYEASQLARSQGKQPLLFNGRAQAERFGRASDVHFSNISADQDEYWLNNVYRSRTRTTLWAKVKEDYAFTRTLNQLGLMNPADLVWELVPYSFVVDWFLPIGPVLTAMTAPAGLDFVGGSTSRRVRAYWDYEIKDKFAGYTQTQNENATGKFRYDGYVRKALTSWPTPGLWFAPDPLGLTRDGSDRSIKALALAIARMPRSL